MSQILTGDRVQVNADYSRYHRWIGTINGIDANGLVWVRLDATPEYATTFLPKELIRIDERPYTNSRAAVRYIPEGEKDQPWAKPNKIFPDREQDPEWSEQ